MYIPQWVSKETLAYSSRIPQKTSKMKRTKEKWRLRRMGSINFPRLLHLHSKQVSCTLKCRCESIIIIIISSHHYGRRCGGIHILYLFVTHFETRFFLPETYFRKHSLSLSHSLRELARKKSFSVYLFTHLSHAKRTVFSLQRWVCRILVLLATLCLHSSSVFRSLSPAIFYLFIYFNLVKLRLTSSTHATF